jgi:EmrB/QacA subfamily drug resistance transporter
MAGDGRADPTRIELDPKRWVTLAIVIIAAMISSLDNTVLNVAIPSILRDFHTDLPSVQWVVSGYALTFATLLIIGGRLGDVYGHRRSFMVGATLFGMGSLIASLASSVPTLLIGEAVIEGIGASLMLPATTAILSTTFQGRERATAFAAWGAAVGSAAAFGPAVGGFLTTYYSWRWALRINVVVAPAAVLGALLFMHRDGRPDRRPRLDLPGAVLIGAGMFMLVFGLSEGSTYGWLTPREPFHINGHRLWPTSRPVSIVVIVFLAGGVILAGFYFVERFKERTDRSPLFEFGQLRHLGYRYGLLTSTVAAMANLGLIFVLPVVLQDGEHLSAAKTGLWLIPFGLFIIIGAQMGGGLARRWPPHNVIRLGLVLESSGLVAVGLAVSPGVTLLGLVPGFFLFGVGYGFASSQLVNVVLSDVPRDKAGVASAANTTARQVGAALGVAVMGAILSAETIRRATHAVVRSGLTASVKAQALAQIRARGVSFVAPPGTNPADAAALGRTMTTSISAGARPALFFAATLAFVGAVVALLIPDTSSLLSHGQASGVMVAEERSDWERTPGGRTPS